MVDACFALDLDEVVECGVCGVRSHALPRHAEFFQVLHVQLLQESGAWRGARQLGFFWEGDLI